MKIPGIYWENKQVRKVPLLNLGIDQEMV